MRQAGAVHADEDIAILCDGQLVGKAHVVVVVNLLDFHSSQRLHGVDQLQLIVDISSLIYCLDILLCSCFNVVCIPFQCGLIPSLEKRKAVKS